MESNCFRIFTIVGLILNTIASLILVLPNLNLRRNIEEDKILEMDKKEILIKIKTF